MDRICLNGRFYEAGSEEAIAQVDADSDGISEWDIFPHDLSNIYFRTSPKDRPQYASATSHNISVPYLQAGYYVRASYILTDYDFSYNSLQSLIGTDPRDNCWEHLSWRTELHPGIAIKNQVEYEEDPESCAPMSAPCHIWWYPTFLTYRGVNLWSGTGIMYNNRAYPEDSECSCYQGVFRNCLSGVQAGEAEGATGKTAELWRDSADDTRERINTQMMPPIQKQRRLPSDR
jgi:hypothetical protein